MANAPSRFIEPHSKSADVYDRSLQKRLGSPLELRFFAAGVADWAALAEVSATELFGIAR
jgi:hypothetical protein